jgi:hypothetical protein
MWNWLTAGPSGVSLPAGLRFEVNASAVAGSLVARSYSYQIGQVSGLAGGGQAYLDLLSFSVVGFTAQSISATVTPGGAVYLNFTPVPEPGTVLGLAVVGALAAEGIRRCHRLVRAR